MKPSESRNPSSTDELEEALAIAMRWKDEPRIGFAPGISLGILSRALLDSRVELIQASAPIASESGRGICPACYRFKARNADDCAAGDCSKWHAVRDKEADADCAAFKNKTGYYSPAPAAKQDDAACLDWLEAHHTLHRNVEILYVVDGYEVTVMHEDGVHELSPRAHGATLREAISAAMRSHSERGGEVK